MKKGDNVINNLEIKRISIINNQELTEAFTFIADESLDCYLKTYMDTTTILADDYIKKELFLYFSDEMSDITWIQAFQMLLQMFRAILSDTVELSETKIDELVDAFMSAIPTVLKSRLQAV